MWELYDIMSEQIQETETRVQEHLHGFTALVQMERLLELHLDPVLTERTRILSPAEFRQPV